VNRLLELAAIGARETMMAQAVNSHNLANAGTPGFRKDLAVYSGTGESGGLSTSIDFSQGTVVSTGHSLDVAVAGQGYIAVGTPEGGEAYSRRGDLRIDAVTQGLTNGAGQPIMGNGGPVVLPPFSELAIGSDGTVSIRPLGGDVNGLAVVDQIKLVNLNEADLEKGLDGLMRLANGGVADFDTTVKLTSGALEGSNVNPVEALVRMIDLARKFESQVKMMQTAEENRQSLNDIMKFS
jgi:flagellar basal-body rod protein FlgF